ncbi:hypothetical protein HYS28_03680 [Candidatus Uhrbacteria bacterium]|nr:hypothetical protein [Candidatus Uhrbacteria bacterium]
MSASNHSAHVGHGNGGHQHGGGHNHGHGKKSLFGRWGIFLAITALIIGMSLANPKEFTLTSAVGGVITWWFIIRLVLWWLDRKAEHSHH